MSLCLAACHFRARHVSAAVLVSNAPQSETERKVKLKQKKQNTEQGKELEQEQEQEQELKPEVHVPKHDRHKKYAA